MLIRCSECANQISDAAQACPHCGKPIVKSTDNRGTKLWISAKEVAQRYSLALSTVQRWAVMGKIPSVLISKRCRRFCVHELDRYFMKHGDAFA